MQTICRAAVGTLVMACIGTFGATGPGVAVAEVSCSGNNINVPVGALQKLAHQEIWAPAFSSGVCNKGTHPTVTAFGASSDAAMKEWNYDGKRGALNRGFAFVGTTMAPTTAQIENIESVAGGAQVAVIPIAQTAIVVITNPPLGCEFEGTTEFITNLQLASVFAGTITSWSEMEGLETEPEKAACESPITRVVRKDAAATTYQFKHYLYRLEEGVLACAGGVNWEELEPVNNSETGVPNTAWPESCGEAALSGLVTPTNGGDAQVVGKVNATPGSIGYVALPTAKANKAKYILDLQNNGLKTGGEANFANAASGKVANCGGIQYSTPANATEGLDIDWSQAFGGRPFVGGKSYPLCTLSFVLALHGYKGAGIALGDEITVNDYLHEYVLREAGQEATNGGYYAALPTAGTEEHDVLLAALKAAGQISY